MGRNVRNESSQWYLIFDILGVLLTILTLDFPTGAVID